MAVVIDEPTDVLTGAAVKSVERHSTAPSRLSDIEDAAVELGIWLSGLESFLTRPRRSGEPLTILRVIRSAFERCARLQLRAGLADDQEGKTDDLGLLIREYIQLSSCMEDGRSLGTGELEAWCRILSDRLRAVPVFHELIANSELNGERYLPEPLKTFTKAAPKNEEEAELALLLPRFAKSLKWLSVIGRMLENDEPLKPAMVIFAHVNEQIVELTGYIDNRLTRGPDENSQLFSSMDAASYTVAIGLRKVFSAEFEGLLSLRAAPSVYAGMETSYAMLNESLQQMVTELGRLVDPSLEGKVLFPASKVNFERSLVLRRELWALIQLTRTAESDPESSHIEPLNVALRQFMNGTSGFLFYKDTETFERFVEEILVTKQTKDLVPILHRFGAYLETLFGQVNLRSALKEHPFEAN